MMLKMFLRSGVAPRPTGFEGLDLEKALKKIPTKDLAIMVFKQLNDHVTTCNRASESQLKVLKWVGWLVLMLSVEKVNEIFHFVNHIPALPGG